MNKKIFILILLLCSSVFANPFVPDSTRKLSAVATTTSTSGTDYYYLYTGSLNKKITLANLTSYLESLYLNAVYFKNSDTSKLAYLAKSNTFTGINTFNGAVGFSAAVDFSGPIQLPPTSVTPANGGMAFTTAGYGIDATYYVAVNNAWDTLATRLWVRGTTTALPSQTGNNGKFLKTDGSTSSWQFVTGSFDSSKAQIITGLWSFNGGLSVNGKYSVDVNGNITKWYNQTVPAPTNGYLKFNSSTSTWTWDAGTGGIDTTKIPYLAKANAFTNDNTTTGSFIARTSLVTGNAGVANGSLVIYNLTNSYSTTIYSPNTSGANKFIATPDVSGTMALLEASNIFSGTTNNFNNGIAVGVSSGTNGVITYKNASNSNGTYLYATTPTATRQIFLPNADGTIALTNGTYAGMSVGAATNAVNATNVTNGVYTNANNTLTGTNTFTSSILLGISGSAAGGVLFYDNTSANMLFLTGNGFTTNRTIQFPNASGTIALQSWVNGGNITTLGTITSGVWNGSTINKSYVSSSGNWDDAYNKTTSLAGLSGILKSNGTGTFSAITDNSANWNTAYTNRPIWGATGGATSPTGYVTLTINGVAYKLWYQL